MSYFPEVIDVRMRDAFVQCQTAFKLEFIDCLVGESGNDPARFWLSLAPSLPNGYHAYVHNNRPVVDEVMLFDLPVSHPMTLKSLKLAVHLPVLAVDEEDGCLDVLAHYEDIDTAMDSKMSAMLWAAQTITNREDVFGRAMLPPYPGLDIERPRADVFRPKWMLERWHAQFLRDANRMTTAYRMGRWDMRLDQACATCDYRPLCLAREPANETAKLHGFKRMQWLPKTQERKELA